MENDFKIDSQLKTAFSIPEDLLGRSNLSTGYNESEDLWEVIVKYNGSLEKIQEELKIQIEILSSNYAIITLRKEDIYLLVFYREIEYIEQPRILTFSLDTALTSSCISSVKNMPYNLTGKGTIVGIIDSGINYTHKDFRNADGTTRVLYIWDQTIEGNAPEGFLGGSLYTRDEINNALESNSPFSVVPSQDQIGHGTAVAGVACGNGASNSRFTGVASESEMIIVKLGERGRESFARNTEIMRAIKFILDKAIELNKPVAINISFGTNDGSHTGGSLFETYIDDMSNIWKTAICVATGNEGSSSHHYEDIAKIGEEITIEIDVSSDLSSLYIVLFKNFSDLFDIKIISPNGAETGYINNSSKQNVYNFGSSSLYINFGEPVPYTLEQGVFFEIIATQNRLESGIWRIVILGKNIVQGRFDVWLPVTEVSSMDTKFLRPSISTTLTIPSTASNVISVGGYNSLTNSIANFSGRGFTRNDQIKPDIVAPAVNITTTSNSNFGGYDTFSGTSIATPFVTGACALLMEWGIVQLNDLFLYGERLKAFLRLGARRNTNLTYPNGEWGFGSLCVSSSLEFLEIYKEPISITSVSNIVSKMELGRIDENGGSVFYSEDYMAVVTQLNSEVLNIIETNDNVVSCGIINGGFIILYMLKDEMDNIISQGLRTVFQPPFLLGLMDKLALEASGVLAVQNQPFLNLKGSGVLIGIVDTGINYTLDEFIYEDNTTKIVSIWDQSIDGSPPLNQCFGTEYTREMIDEALSSENPFEIVPTRDEIGHGTNIASICAGRQSIDKDFIGVAPDSELVIVKLRQAKQNLRDIYLVNSDIPAYDISDVMLGVQYLYDKSVELDKPLAIYMGLGTNYGAHNGFTMIEKFLSNIAIINGIGLCICTGNEGNEQHHAVIKLSEIEEEESFEVRVGENELGFVVTIVTYPGDRIGVNIISPNGRSTGRIAPRNNYDEEIFFPLDNTRIRVQYFLNSYQNSGQIILLTFKTPSDGIWKINIFAETLLIGDVHAWLPISNFISDGTYFLNSDPFYTITVPSTASSVVSVGGYNSLNGSFFASSGRGPTFLNFLKPTICAPSVNVSCVGVTGQLERISGTSVGTAITAGCAALLLEWGIVRGNSPVMNSISLIGTLTSGSKKVPNEILPNNMWGYGILDMLGALDNLY